MKKTKNKTEYEVIAFNPVTNDRIKEKVKNANEAVKRYDMLSALYSAHGYCVFYTKSERFMTGE